MMMVVPHRCHYGHEWELLLDTSFYYHDPRMRFCHECLEAGHIEVAAIKVHTTSTQTILFSAICFVCHQNTAIPLVPDWSGTLYLIDMHDLLKVEPRWFYLPIYWPRCHYCEASFLPTKKEHFLGNDYAL